jgi:endonuclease/exonuclease/phosphatase (EEP) superfamily protein YafD
VAPRSSARTVLLGVGLALAPWAWFPLRGRIGELGDLLAVFLPVLWLICIAGAIVLAVWGPVPRWAPAVWGVSATVVVAGCAIGPRLPDDAGVARDPVRVVAANVYYRNDDEAAAVDDLVARDADVVVLSEVTYLVITGLSEHYPYVATDCLAVPRCDAEVAVLSRYPLHDAERRVSTRSVLRVVVSGPEPFVLLAAHLPRPALRPDNEDSVTFGRHRSEIDRLVREIDDEELPVVLAGDLNLSDRTSGYRALDDAMVDATRTGWAATTFPFGVFRPLLLRIDHVLVSPGWCGDDAATFGISGSDHRGVEASVGPCA